jgi:hypothetical protein
VGEGATVTHRRYAVYSILSGSIPSRGAQVCLGRRERSWAPLGAFMSEWRAGQASAASGRPRSGEGINPQAARAWDGRDGKRPISQKITDALHTAWGVTKTPNQYNIYKGVLVTPLALPQASSSVYSQTTDYNSRTGSASSCVPSSAFPLHSRDIRGGTPVATTCNEIIEKIQPSGITCLDYDALPGRKHCRHYVEGGACARPDEFQCVEWLKVNAEARPTPRPQAPADLFGNPIPEPKPAMPPIRSIEDRIHQGVPGYASVGESDPGRPWAPLSTNGGLSSLRQHQAALVLGWTSMPE